VIRTDHFALTWLRRTPDPIGQQGRWLEIMEEFDFVIEHRPGARHGNADALSRRPCCVRDCACHMAEQDTLDCRGLIQEVENPSSGFIGGSADCRRASGLKIVQTVINDRNEVTGNTEGAVADVPSWSHDGLCAAQRKNPDVSFILRLMEQSQDKPQWGEVALSSQSVKTLWNQWPRLAI